MSETGLFFKTKKIPGSVPLKKTSYEIKVAGICADITIIQKYVNKAKSSVEAVYLFPKEDGAVITGFSFETEGRRYKTSVEEKDQAFKKYDDAIKKGDGATLLDEVTRDILQLSVGNLKPDQEITFTIKMAQELSVIDGTFRLHFPLTRFPRYQGPGADPAGFLKPFPTAQNLTSFGKIR